MERNRVKLIIALLTIVAPRCIRGQNPSVALLEFTQQLYSVQENLGPLAVNLRLASNSPPLASNLGANPVQVRISSDGTGNATASSNPGADYNPVSILVSFNAGDGPLTLSQPQVSITIINDNSVEQTETFGLTGTITSGAALAQFVDNTATVQIIDDDVPITMRFSQPTYSQSESFSPLSVSLVLDANSGVAVQSVVAEITASSQPGDTATDSPGTDADYTGTTCTVTFSAGSAPGATSTLCNIPLISDLCLEEDEIFSLTATIQNNNGQTAQFTTGGDSATATIIDDDAVTVQLVSSGPGGVGSPSQSVQENGANPICCAQLLLTGGVTIKRNIVVTLFTGTGTATAGTDYTAVNSVMTFTPANQRQLQCVTISVADDLICEADETFSCQLTSTEDPSEVNLNPSFGLVTIVDNDVVTVELVSQDPNTGVIGLPDVSVLENGTDPTLCVQLSGGVILARIVTVTLSTDASGTAQAGSDYTAVTFQMTFAPADQAQILCRTIPVIDDLILEAAETIPISVTTADPAVTLSPSASMVTIIDNDVITVGLVPDPTLETPNYQIPENSLSFQFCAQITAGSLAPGRIVVVNLATLEGPPPPVGAQDPEDYIGGSFPLVFTSTTGQNISVCSPVEIVNDNLREAYETFLIQLSIRTGETQVILNPLIGTATIIDDDVPVCNEISSLDMCFSAVTRTIKCIGETEVSSENAQEVVSILTMSVQLACEDDQTATNFAVITEVIVNTSAIVAQTGGTAAIPLQQQINITMNVLQIIDRVSMWPVGVTNAISPRLIRAFEVIVVLIVQNETFGNFVIVGDDVALLAERVAQENLERGRTFGASGSDDGPVLVSIRNSTITTLPQDQDAAISLPPSLFDLVNTTEVGIGFIFYETAALFPLPEGSPSNLTIGSSVIGALVGDQNFSDLQDPVIIFLHLTRQNLLNPQCASWDFTAAGGRGNWTTDGCELTGLDDNVVICQCNHLTNFAVLVDICTRIGDCLELPPPFQVALTVITIVGTALSLFGLAVTIITLLVFKKLRERDVTKFHIQLCIALFCMLLVFVSGIDQTQTYGGCVTVSALIHYFTLVTWMWMGAEAVLMFQKVVIVFFHITTRYIIAVSFVCWLLPIVPVVIPMAIDRDFMVTFPPAAINSTISTVGISNITHMDSIRYCFIGNTGVFFGAFLGPIFAILLFNAFIFVSVMSVLAKQIHKKFANKDQANRKTVVRLMISMMGVMALFGLTWVFGALTVHEASTAFQFLFAIFNSLQGFFIFLFFCVFGREGKAFWLQVLCCGRKVPGVTGSAQPNVKVPKCNAPRKPSDPDSLSTGLRSGPPASSQGAFLQFSGAALQPENVFSENEISQEMTTVKANPMALQLEAREESHINQTLYSCAEEESSSSSHFLAVKSQNAPIPVRCRSTIRHGHHEQTAEIHFGDNIDESDK